MRASLVIPVYNEEDSIDPLGDELRSLLTGWPEFEIIFVDDGSADRTWTRLLAVADRQAAMRVLRLPRHAGQSSALWHGLQAARGDILVTMDGDLQSNPSDIPRLIGALDLADVVCGYRTSRCDTWGRRMASQIGNCVRQWVLHDGVRDTGCGLKAFRRECLADLPPLDGMHRFMPAYFRLHGRKVIELAVEHRPRRHGKSKYTILRRLPHGLLDLVGFIWLRRRFRPRQQWEEPKARRANDPQTD